MDRVHFETLGCKLNQIETESLANAFREAGFSVDRAESSAELGNSSETSDDAPAASADGLAGICVVNTCTVTGKAEQKARRVIRHLLGAHPGSPVIVTGCYAEVEAPTLSAIDPRVVVFPGGRKGDLARLPDFLAARAIRHPEEPLLDAVRDFVHSVNPGFFSDGNALPSSTFALSTDNFLFHSRASIKIQDGCNNHCSYCRIRLARGKSVSLDADEVLARINKIAEAGWREVILAGVNLSQYRSAGGDFAYLLERILSETTGVAIRISSLYPERIDAALLPLLANPRVRPHFHLSVQSGSDRVLSAMRRPYTAETVYRAAEGLRAVRENPFIACDIITGFPGETDEDFARTLEMCQKIGFAWIHAFPFSARPGTEAYSLKPKIPERIAGERVRALTALAEENHRRYYAQWIGREIAAIAEKVPDGMPVTAVTENYLSVKLPPRSAVPASALIVRIEPEGFASIVP